MNKPKPIRPDRIRVIKGSFSWVDHKFITSGYINLLSKEEIVLYYFLTTVGDRNGISYYHQDTICRLLKLDLTSFTKARDDLVFKDLIACRRGMYQVLSLPEEDNSPRETSYPMKMNQIFKSIGISNT